MKLFLDTIKSFKDVFETDYSKPNREINMAKTA